jgi:hypothetical protein
MLFDFLVDLTMSSAKEPRSGGSPTAGISSADDAGNLADEERAFLSPHAVPLSVRSSNGISSTANEDNEETELRTRPSSISSSTGNYLKRKTSQIINAVTSSSSAVEEPLSPPLASLVEAYTSSTIAAEIKADMEEVVRVNGRGNGNGEMRDVAIESTLLKGRKRATWMTQFRILSGRAFKNLYRDPALLAAHYLSSIALACEFLYFSCSFRFVVWTAVDASSLFASVICGLFFHNVT